VDDTELIGLDPSDLLDREAARIDSYLSTLPDDEWERPSRCAGWSVRDVAAHLAASEAYHRACLDGNVKSFLATEMAGVTDLAGANARGIARLTDRTNQQVLTEWRESNAETRRRFRERGDGVIDSSVGEYPSRWQAFHVAGELATHADDVFVPVTSDEREERMAWRARFSRFSLVEAKPDLVLTVHGGETTVEGSGVRVAVDDETLIESVAGRLVDSPDLTPAELALLSTMP
jgi:uncharacterized protein (TIGR03083 family)